MVPTNHELQLAHNFVRDTGCNLFLTGKAGTGKTTFLRSLPENTPKRMIVTAPTGVAAINAGGVTLHSFFQLPFGPYVPGSESYERNRQRHFRFSKEKKRIIKSLDLLVIDEISMVRADLLDAVDATLRRHRRSSEPFGGVQLLMIGDLHQLSPVAKQEEWRLLQNYYDSVYFFSSRALEQTRLVTIELKRIYRQSDSRFIEVLNRVRDNRLDETAQEALNSRYIPNYEPKDSDGSITLTTHNASADSINLKKLESLKGKQWSFNAEIDGDFPEHTYPTANNLHLKEGAQVMFVRNDPSSDKRYFNGKIGAVTRISQSRISVLCPGEQTPIEVEPLCWENIKYTFNDNNKEIEEETIGSFTQYPLKPAWAITIHKSQGLTFDRAVIDAKAAFAHGQIYVALSRCRTLEGLVLSSPISTTTAQPDEALLHFDQQGRQNPPSADLLQGEKRSYQQQLLLDCFDFSALRNRLNYLVHLFTRHNRVIQPLGNIDLDQLKMRAGHDIFMVSDSFKRELQTIFSSNTLPESDPHTVERIAKGSCWFQEKLKDIFEGPLTNLGFETDNAEIRKQINRRLNELNKEFRVKLAAVHSCENSFSPSNYLRAVSAAEIDFQPEKPKKEKLPEYSEQDIDHPELFALLRQWRTDTAQKEQVAHFQVMYQRVLIQIVIYLPDNLTDLQRIKGVGPKTVGKYGDEIIDMVAAYRRKHGITEVILPEAPKTVEKETKPQPKKNPPARNTAEISFDLFNEGKSIEMIVEERGRTRATIERHLCFFIKSGELDVNRLLSSEKQQKITKVLETVQTTKLKELKEALGEGISYGEIKIMLAHQKHLEL